MTHKTRYKNHPVSVKMSFLLNGWYYCTINRPRRTGSPTRTYHATNASCRRLAKCLQQRIPHGVTVPEAFGYFWTS
jgi:hypothetical protein